MMQMVVFHNVVIGRARRVAPRPADGHRAVVQVADFIVSQRVVARFEDDRANRRGSHQTRIVDEAVLHQIVTTGHGGILFAARLANADTATAQIMQFTANQHVPLATFRKPYTVNTAMGDFYVRKHTIPHVARIDGGG